MPRRGWRWWAHSNSGSSSLPPRLGGGSRSWRCVIRGRRCSGGPCTRYWRPAGGGLGAPCASPRCWTGGRGERAGRGGGDRAGGAQLAVVLPFFMTVWMLLGGQYAALDLGAGERERGTLPGLLLTPPDRLALVLGKFATVFTLATTSVVLVVGTVLLSLRLAPLSAAPTSLSGGAVVSLVGVGLVFAAFLSALQLLLSLAARSVREAQQLFTPVYLLAVGSVLLTQILPEWGQRLWLYALPAVNGAFLLRGLLLDAVGLPEIVLAGGGLLLLTAGTLALGAWVYGRERLVAG